MSPSAGRANAGGRRASQNVAARALPIAAANATWSGSQVSSVAERTLEMWVPSERWTPEKRKGWGWGEEWWGSLRRGRCPAATQNQLCDTRHADTRIERAPARARAAPRAMPRAAVSALLLPSPDLNSSDTQTRPG